LKPRIVGGYRRLHPSNRQRPSACVVKTVSGLFVRNDASRQRGVGTDVKSEYRREDEPTEFAALYRIEFLEDGLRSIHREGPRRAMPH